MPKDERQQELEKQQQELEEQAAQNWHLEKLFKDLSQAKQQLSQSQRKLAITPIDKKYLYGVLERVSPAQMADIYDKPDDLIRSQLSSQLYKYIKKLLGYSQSENISSIDIPQELERLGYKRGLSTSHWEQEKVFWNIGIEMDINDFTLLSTIVDRLGRIMGTSQVKIQKIELGSVLIVCESYRQEFAKVEDFFIKGRLTELLGVKVINLFEISASGIFQYLRHLYPNIYEQDYQPIALVFAPNKRRSFRSNRTEDLEEIEPRAKLIHLGDKQTVYLIVQLILKDEKIGIKIWVYPSGDVFYLPQGLQVKILDESGEPVPDLQEQANSTDKAILLPFTVEPGEPFSVKLTLGDINVTENF